MSISTYSGNGSNPVISSQPAAVPLRNEAESLIADIALFLRNNDVRLDISPALYVVAEPWAVREILMNLVTNAAKHSAVGSAITVDAALADEYVKVNVHNEANGSVVRDLDRIFESGYLVSANGDTPGSGLGLSIAHALVTRLGGRIWAESGAGGTNFAFTVPAAWT
jgi:signal transduction histidine kinase